MTTLSMTDARLRFTDVANEVMFTGQRVCVSKNSKPAFGLVPITDIELLEALEDYFDLQDALKALKEPGGMSLKELKKRLGL